MNPRLLRLIAGSVLVVTVAACGSSAAAPATNPTAADMPLFAIRTPAVQPQACMEALMVGSLERLAATGLGIGTAEGITPVEWPFGFSARVVNGAVVLLDRTGKVVAREHDRVHMGGGQGAGGIWFACGDIAVESNEGG